MDVNNSGNDSIRFLGTSRFDLRLNSFENSSVFFFLFWKKNDRVDIYSIFLFFFLLPFNFSPLTRTMNRGNP